MGEERHRLREGPFDAVCARGVRIARCWATAGWVVLCGPACARSHEEPPRAGAQVAPEPQAERRSPPAEPDVAPPPAVLGGNGKLDCTISRSEPGHQKLSLINGQGLEFDVQVSPILDGVVRTKGPALGGSYAFTSHLAGPGKGTLSGVGDVTIDELDTKVNVAMLRYKQPDGPGSELTFSSADMRTGA